MVVYSIYIYIYYGGGGPPGPKNARADFLSQSSPACETRSRVNVSVIIMCLFSTDDLPAEQKLTDSESLTAPHSPHRAL